MSLTSSGKEALKEKTAGRLRYRVCSVTLESIYKTDRDPGVAPYNSTKILETCYIERGDSKLVFLRSWTTLNVWVVLIGAAMDLVTAVRKKPYLSVPGGQYVRAGHDCRTKVGKITVKYGKVADPFTVMDLKTKPNYLLVCSESRSYVHYKMAEKKNVVEVLRLEGLSIAPILVLVGHRYLQD